MFMNKNKYIYNISKHRLAMCRENSYASRYTFLAAQFFNENN